MAKWQQLLEMLLDPNLTPGQVYVRLNLCPSQVRRMLTGKRLRARLSIVQDLALGRASDRALRAANQIPERLAELTKSEQPEVARKACTDMLAVTRQAILDRAGGTQRTLRYPRVRMADGRIVDPNIGKF